MPASRATDASTTNPGFGAELLRAFGGAILFAFPMLMTMEMWWLGFSIDPLRLALLTLLDIPLLIGLAYYAGFAAPSHWLADILNAFTAYAVGFAAAALLLAVLAVLEPGMSADEILGKIAIQAVPASIGAMLARSQLDASHHQHEARRSEHYGGAVFLMLGGALFLSASVAATEEIRMIASNMTPLKVGVLMVLSLILMQGLAHATIARGKSHAGGDAPTPAALFFRFAVVGYAIALLVSLYILWTFGRTEGVTLEQSLRMAVVLGFPAALGAGAARLIL
jgi:putative integral membrane protein (TIGR02587 family)